jgi:hypothetical protein
MNSGLQGQPEISPRPLLSTSLPIYYPLIFLLLDDFKLRAAGKINDKETNKCSTVSLPVSK